MLRRVLHCVVLIFLLALTLSAQEKDKAEPSTEFETTASPEVTLRALIRAGRLDDLRWPDFSDYRDQVGSSYSHAEYAPAWLRQGQPTPQALQMIDILQQADSEGLHPEDYDSSRWTQRLERLQGQHAISDDVRFDLALTVCAMRYASSLRRGRINPQYFQFALDSGPEELDLAKFVRQRLAAGSDLKSDMAKIEPPFTGYRELHKALLKYMQLAKQDDGEKLPPPTGSGYPGPPYPGFIRLTRLLRLLGDLPENYSVAAASAQAYDPALLQAVRHFQERHRIPATGYLNAETVEELNVPLPFRVEQIRLAMERYRWLRYQFPQPPIVVNIPGYRLDAYAKDGKVALTMTVDVGEDFDSTRTPVMEDSIEYVVFRPYWEVPPGIQKEEITDAIKEDPNYLSKYRLQVISPNGQVITSGRVSPTVFRELATGRVRVRQRPGPDNALGLIKFIFPNRYSVYLHDIPARDFYFGMGKRVVSHGCVHVEKPAELAAWMLRDQPAWTLQRIQQAMHAGPDNRRVNLSKPLPVLLLYTTASARENGEVYFYRDIYQYDADLRQALAKGYPYPSQALKGSEKSNVGK